MRRIALFGGAAAAVLLAAAQLILPGIAAEQLRDRLAHSGRVVSVDVEAFPAIELLWHQAGRVDVHLASYHATTTRLGRSLAQTSEAGPANPKPDHRGTRLVAPPHAPPHTPGDGLIHRAVPTPPATP